ncbi:MAG: ester cyclase [Actinomycetota bacterium]
MSDVDRNMDVIRRLEDAYETRDYDAVRTLIAADIATHTPGSEMMPAGVEGCIAANEGGYAFFPDKRAEITDLFGEGDRTVVHIRMTGTNTGAPVDWAGLTEATNKPIDIDWIQVARHDAVGRIVETWAQMDSPKMMVQLGAMPAPEGM